MARPDSIELPGCKPIPILYEDRQIAACAGFKMLR
jgi:hypothetical protein